MILSVSLHSDAAEFPFGQPLLVELFGAVTFKTSPD